MHGLQAILPLGVHRQDSRPSHLTFSVHLHTSVFPICDCDAWQFPVLETPQGSISESAAISRYIASIGQGNLYPEPLNPTGMLVFAHVMHLVREPHVSNFAHAADITRAEVDAWVDWCSGPEVSQLACIWPMLRPGMPYDKAAYFRGKAQLSSQLEALERHLAAGRTYLVGQALSLADIIVAWVLMTPYLVVRALPRTATCA